MRLLTRLKALSHTLQTSIEANLYRRQQEFTSIKQLIQSQPKVFNGHYGVQGASKYIQNHPNIHYKQLIHQPDLRVSPIGIGTYRGSLDQSDDQLMFNGLVDSILAGCNVIDTCRNFRKGRSEQMVGLALRYLCEDEGYERSNFFLSSKAGYVFEDLPHGVQKGDIINDHCVHSIFLRSQLQKSLRSLGVSTIDLYYLNNFAECQMQKLGKKEFQNRLAKAFETLQMARSEGKIKFYGLSSWQAFRVGEGNPGHLSLHSVIRVAQQVGGKSHGMRFLQLPINIMMPQAFADKYRQNQSFLDVAEELQLNVVSNSPFLSGTLINIPMPASLLKCNNNGSKHLQLIRSIPSKALVCTLVGQKLNRHVKKNLEVLTVEALNEGEWLNVFVPKAEPNPVEV